MQIKLKIKLLRQVRDNFISFLKQYHIYIIYHYESRLVVSSLITQLVKNLPAMRENRV